MKERKIEARRSGGVNRMKERKITDRRRRGVNGMKERNANKCKKERG